MVKTGLEVSEEATGGGSPAAVVLAWAVVAIPAAWGIYNTVLRAAGLFTR